MRKLTCSSGVNTQTSAYLQPHLKPHCVLQVTDALHRAGSDERVQGLTSCISDHQIYAGLAAVQELRNSVLNFRQATTGKLTCPAPQTKIGTRQV